MGSSVKFRSRHVGHCDTRCCYGINDLLVGHYVFTRARDCPFPTLSSRSLFTYRQVCSLAFKLHRTFSSGFPMSAAMSKNARDHRKILTIRIPGEGKQEWLLNRDHEQESSKPTPIVTPVSSIASCDTASSFDSDTETSSTVHSPHTVTLPPLPFPLTAIELPWGNVTLSFAAEDGHRLSRASIAMPADCNDYADFTDEVISDDGWDSIVPDYVNGECQPLLHMSDEQEGDCDDLGFPRLVSLASSSTSRRQCNPRRLEAMLRVPACELRRRKTAMEALWGIFKKRQQDAEERGKISKHIDGPRIGIDLKKHERVLGIMEVDGKYYDVESALRTPLLPTASVDFS